MNLVARVKNILMTPKTEWPVIAAEPATVGGLYTGYAAILALLPLAGGILAALLFLPAASALLGLGASYFITMAIVQYVVSLAVLYLVALAIEALAPSFEGKRSRVDALKWLMYAATSAWVASFFIFIPVLGALLALAGAAYAIYLLYLGAAPVMGVPQEKAMIFTLVAVVILIVIGWIVNMIVARILLSAFFHPVMPLTGF